MHVAGGRRGEEGMHLVAWRWGSGEGGRSVVGVGCGGVGRGASSPRWAKRYAPTGGWVPVPGIPPW